MSSQMLVIVALVVMAPGAFGAVRFDAVEIRLHPTVDDQEARATFVGRNEGDQVVKIVGVKSQCGCTVADVSTRSVEPGEMVEIEAVFRFGGRMGEQRKIVTVQTDDGQPPQDLAIVADIPRLLAYDTRVVRWRVGSSGEAQDLRVTVGSDDVRITDAAVTCDDASFEVSADVVEGGTEIVVTVIPKTTEVGAIGRISLEVNLGRSVDLNLYAVVK